MHLRPCLAQDISAMADIMVECNIDDSLSRHMTRDIFKYWTSYRKGGIRYLVNQTLVPGAASWVLETDAGDQLPNGEPGPGGDIVGFAQWHRIGTSPAARNWQAPGKTWDQRLERTFHGVRDKYYSFSCLDPVNNRKSFPGMMRILEKPFDPGIFAEAWELSGLNVRREYQRRGLAKILLKWGLDQAAAEKVPAVVKSSPTGLKTYEQAGFRLLESLDFAAFDFDPGGRGVNTLVWEPPGMEGQWYDRAKRKVEKEKDKTAAEGAVQAVTSRDEGINSSGTASLHV